MVPTLALLEIVLCGQAVLDVVGLLGGHRAAELVPHLAYLVTSLIVSPIAANQVHGESGRWPGLLLAFAFLVLAVIEVRPRTTLRS